MNKPYFNMRNIILEIAAYLIILAALIYATVCVFTIDGEIPTHYNMAGEIDGYGSAGVLFILPVMMLLLDIMTSLIAHFAPVKYFNMPFVIKPGRQIKVYGDMMMMLMLLELEINVFTLWETVTMANGISIPWVVWVWMAILFASIILVVMKAAKDNR